MVPSGLSRAHKRALRDRHECRARDAKDATTRATSAVDADGEGVWSWHPWAGAKPVDDLQATVTKKSHGHRGEREDKP